MRSSSTTGPATVGRQPAGGAMSSEASGVQVAVAAYLIWGFLTVYWKQLAQFDPVELIGWRMMCAGVVMAVVVTIRRTWPAVVAALRDGRQLVRLALAAMLLAVNWWSYVYAVVNDRVVETALGYFMAPLATMLLGVIVLHEQARRAQQIAFGCAAIAVVILSIAAERPPWIALLIAATWSLYGLSKRKIQLGPVEGLAAETFVLVVPATLFVIVSSARADSLVATATAGDWPFVVGTGVVTAIPLILFAAAARAIPFTLLGPLNLLVPIINFGLGWLWYGEEVPAWRLAGFALVWAAVVIVMADRIVAGRALARQRAAPPI